MDPLRLAIVGCGGITERGLLPHLELEQDRAEVVALCDVSEQRLRAVCSEIWCSTDVYKLRGTPSQNGGGGRSDRNTNPTPLRTSKACSF